MCTSVFIGKDVSAEGTRILARSEDQVGTVHPKRFFVKEPSSQPGRRVKDTGEGRDLAFPLPDVTCKYTVVPDYTVLGDGDYCSVCINEYGLMISATMSLVNLPEEYLALDPLKEEGTALREANMCEPVICQARNCREAVRVLGDLMETYGSEESNAVLFMDKEEAWIFEIYGGTSWAAMRLPDDKVAAIGTLVMLEWVNLDNPGDDWYVSPNLKGILDRLPAQVVREDGAYNITDTIVPGQRTPLYTLRIWRLLQRMAPSKVGDYDEDAHYPLLIEPDQRVSVLEVMKFFGDRLEGTGYDVDLLPWEEKKTRFPAGDTNQSAVHVIQTFEDLPDRCCQLQWLAMANAEYSVYVPAFSGISDTFEKYKTDAKEDGLIDEGFYYLCKRIWALAVTDRDHLGKGVSRFQRAQEKKMFDQIMKELDPVREAYRVSDAEGDRYVTDLAARMAADQYDIQLDLYRRLFFRHMFNCDDFIEEKKNFEMEEI